MRCCSQVLLLSIVFALFARLSHAEQILSTPKYNIHYIAFNTMMLTPAVANTYGFTRARNRALVNISILEVDTGKAVMGQVTGKRKNLVGQVYPLDFQQIVEQGAIYYLAPMRFSEAEYWQFNLQIQPDPYKPAISLNFNQKFYLEK